MIHYQWKNKKALKRVKCVDNEAKKYIVNHKLTIGKKYHVINETNDFYFVIDNSGRIGGFFKYYFKLIS